MKIKEGYTLRQVAGSFVVMNLGGENSFNGMITLNETGAFIWQKLSEGKSVEQIADDITSEYDIDKDTAKKDIEIFISKMAEAGVLSEL